MGKNIFLIETDKPTGIFETNSGLRFSIMNKVRYGEFKGFHLYITSDEEIKEGEEFWYNNGGEWYKAIYRDYYKSLFPYGKKIILTTDQLLKGVQCIDIEFLEWFVKNPSCEEVETKLVEFEVDMGLGDSCVERGSYYEIIIPQEEPKQECCQSVRGQYLGTTCPKCNKPFRSVIDKSKQETLEEIPKELEPILSKISHINDLGLSQWYEVVYYADDKWCSYSGSKTFEDGERVIDWKYCKEQF